MEGWLRVGLRKPDAQAEQVAKLSESLIHSVCFLYHLRERNDPACATLRIFRRVPVDGKGFGKAAYGLLPDAVLNMEIMLSHIHVGVSYDTLDGREIHAQRLQLADIGMSAAVRCQQSYTLYRGKCFAEMVAVVAGVAGQVFSAFLENEFRVYIAKLHRISAGSVPRHRCLRRMS